MEERDLAAPPSRGQRTCVTAFRRPFLAGFALATGLTAGSCGDHGTGTEPGLSSLTLLRGDGVTDTVLSLPAQALVVEVRGEGGALVSGTVVRFQALTIEGANPYLLGVYVAPVTSQNFGSFVADSTDSRGRSSVLVQLGTRAGAAKLLVSVPEFGLQDTARFTVLPGKGTLVIVQPKDTALYVGRGFQSRATVGDRFGNPRSDPVSYSAGSTTISITSSGRVTGGGNFARAFYTANAQGGTDTGWVSVVPQGTLAALQVDSLAGHGPGIVTFNLDGSGYSWIGRGGSYYNAAPSWAPSGTTLAFGGNPGFQTWLYSSDLSGNERALLASGDSGLTIASWPAYSHDGTYIYFSGATTANFGLWRANADGTEPHLLYTDPSGLAWRSSPSPDGTRLAFTNASTYPAGVQVYTLATGSVSSWAVVGHTPRWSPANETVAFVTPYGGSVFVMSSDGTGVRQVTRVGRFYGETSLTWSPDGVWLAVRGPASLELVNVATGTTLPLGYSTSFIEPAWKP